MNISVEANLGLVGAVVNRFHARLPNLDRDDMFHAGVVALIDAARLFRPETGFQFSTYATIAISRRVVENMNEQSNGISRGKADGYHRRGEKIPHPVSMHYESQKGREGVLEIADTRPSPVAVAAENEADAGKLAGLDSLLSELTERERRVLHLRFVEGVTLREVGEEIGVTRERVRQIETEAIAKARKLGQHSRFRVLRQHVHC
jgi:RNA polymerase sigma factor (sigma-70 family)